MGTRGLAALDTFPLRPLAAGDTFPGRELLTAGNGDPEDVATDGSVDTGDDGRLIPAVYAWDRDVRFASARHVHRWL